MAINKSNKVVLVVEDEEALRNLYASWLEDEGYQTRLASDGSVALKKWNDKIDVALVDRRMPDMSGDDLVDQIREKGYHTPISMVTAVQPQMDLIELQFDRYITKPTERLHFLEVVEDLLKVSEVRSVVRDYVRTGITVHEIQQQHRDSVLETHAEFQELNDKLKKLHKQVTENIDNLTKYEEQMLVVARDKVKSVQ